MSVQEAEYCGITWVDYEICDHVAAIDKCNEQAWLECADPVEVER